MDPFESQLRSLPLRQPSEGFGQPETLASYLETRDRPQMVLQPQTILQRINAMPWTSKAATLVGLCAIAFVLFFVFAGPVGSAVAFAQVAEKLQAAKTISFDSVITSTADGKTLRKSRDYFMSPGKSRHEVLFPESDAGAIVIDFPAGKSIGVSSKTKTAFVGSIKGGGELDQLKKMMDYLRSLPEKSPRPLGNRQIEGVSVKGFELDSSNETTSVWAHATTGNPVRIEILHKNTRPGPQTEVMTNIKLDEKLDPELFSLEPPAGYQVRQNATMDLDGGPPSYVAGLLKTYAKYMDGEFPRSLSPDGLAPLHEKLLKSGLLKPDQVPDQDDLLQLPGYAVAVAAVTSKLKEGQRWQYYPGVTLGKRDQIVFWYLDTKMNTYTAVFGDLRIEKVTKEQLPSAGQGSK
jgi:outer membrane lipoprotein-sorting protein